jgi:hypothetical protein
MSTTFDVFPHHAKLPSFGALVERTMPRIREYLDRHGIRHCPPLGFDVRDNNHESQGYTQVSSMQWSKQHYAWFYFDGLAGGTDAYWLPIDELMVACWTDEKRERERSKQLAAYIDECLAIGYRWYFRRSAGQPALINLAYGYLAASLAELTEGLVFSDDSAWDYERFPCHASEFFEFYFEPDKAIGSDYREWSRRCLEFLREETRSIG